MDRELLFQTCTTAALTCAYAVFFFKVLRLWRRQMWAGALHGLMIPSLWFACGIITYRAGYAASSVLSLWGLMLCGAVSTSLFHLIGTLGEKGGWWSSKAELLERLQSDRTSPSAS